MQINKKLGWLNSWITLYNRQDLKPQGYGSEHTILASVVWIQKQTKTDSIVK